MAQPGTIEGFEADLKAFAKLIDAELETVIRRVTLSLLTKIIKRTPVDTGRARASWVVTVGSPDTSTVAPEGGTGGDADVATTVAMSRVPAAGPYVVYWITNNLPYIRTLEFGEYPGDGPKTTGGFSSQAPQGMVRVSLAEVEAELTAEISRRT